MKSELKILVADDDPVLLELLPAQLSAKDLRIKTVDSGSKVLDILSKDDFDVILLDVNLPDVSGVELLSKIRSEQNMPEVVMLTADKSLNTGIEAMRRGAYDYVTKPAEPNQIEAVVRKAAEKSQLVRQNEKLKVAVQQQNANLAAKPIFSSASMKEVYRQAGKVADLDTTLLITGESGTGKDVLARWIHNESSRADLPLVLVNCGALPENLFESEFFGYEKGAFTGAGKKKIGLIEAADGSTLFLDEIGEMPLTMQVKLLHFLENGMFRRVGSTRDQKVDARIIAATNKDLSDEINAGNFRSDLFYRLNVISFHLPALRERPEDISALIKHFLGSLSERYGRGDLQLSNKAQSQLNKHDWHGNIRELKNILERTVALSSGDTIGEIYGLHGGPTPGGAGTQLAEEIDLVPLAEVEKRHILETLSKVGGKREKAAAILGITSRTLYRKLKEYGTQS